MLSIKINLAYSIKQIFSICFLAVTFFSFSVFGQVQKTQEAHLLPANQTVERELSGGQTHKYLISLKANEFLQIMAEQKGTDIVVRLFDSNQGQLAEVDSPNGTQGFEKILFITEREGKYEIQISSFDEKAATGKYTLQWSRQIATEKDRSQINVKKLYEDGIELLNKLETRSDGITKLEEVLKLYQQIKDRGGEGDTLFALGSAVLRYLTQYEKARDYFEQTLIINREIKDRWGEGVTLNNLGNVYSYLAQYEKARHYYEQALIINREIKNRRDEGRTLNNLGIVYNSLAQYEEARHYYEQALIIIREVKTEGTKAGR